VSESVGCDATTDTRVATVIQTRHRIPEEGLGEEQVLVFQVPVAEPLRGVQKSVAECDRMHAEADYSAIWVSLYEDIVRNGFITKSTGYPALVNGRYVMATTPVPRWDVPRLHSGEHLNLYGAGRERRIYAVPPHTDVRPLTFDDVPFEVEHVPGARCDYCGSDDTFLVEGSGGRYVCSDSDWCSRSERKEVDAQAHRQRAPLAWLPDPSRRANSRSVIRTSTPDSPAQPASGRVSRQDQDWILKVDRLGKVFGAGGARAVAGTGPEHGTAVSPATGAIVAAWDVSFDVAPGEALGLIGESGSGKSTVLNCLIGDERATTGTVRLASVDGGETDLLTLSPQERRKLRPRAAGPTRAAPRPAGRPATPAPDPAHAPDINTSAAATRPDQATQPPPATQPQSRPLSPPRPDRITSRTHRQQGRLRRDLCGRQPPGVISADACWMWLL
jgi:alpha-D-ribose 1-methylphosphonate 5-phosphate C-P lyase